MKDFTRLTNRGKLRRIRKLAESALLSYALKNPVLEYYGFETNCLFKVTAGTGERYMLRLATPGWRTYTDLLSEALWLEALAKDTSIPVPGIIPTRTGEYVQKMKSPEVPITWHISLMTWLPGRDLGGYLTPENIRKMGRLFAELHIHGKEWKPPENFTTQVFSHWLSRNEEKKITDPDFPLFEKEYILKVHDLVEQEYSRIPPHDLRVIHCDLWHDNIKLNRGILCPLDFEDTVLGYRSHDIAMAMLDLLEATDEERYDRLLPCFKTGYEELLGWPQAPIEPFQIGRLLWKINWVARFQPERLYPMVKNHLPVFRHYEKTGKLILPKD